MLARKSRFDNDTIKRVVDSDFNPYFGIRRMMEIERDVGVRSTFFFRPVFDDSSLVDEYADDIRVLEQGGWEVGVHLNDTSNIENASAEKKSLDRLTEKETIGTRAHYLRIDREKIPDLRKVGFLYDSSFTFSKHSIDERNAEILRLGPVAEFPVTFMDAFLFSYLHINEDDVVDFVTNKIKELKEKGYHFSTILWHDNVLLMQGGRKYSDLLRSIYSIEGIEIRRGIDVLNNLK